MAGVFFEEFQLSEPDYLLNIGSGTFVHLTDEIMRRFEEILRRENPDLVVVVGDSVTAMAAALVTAKMDITLAHVEAGLRSYHADDSAEVNRLTIDTLSQYLFASTRRCLKNLRKEGIAGNRIFQVGNILADSLRMFQLPVSQEFFARLNLIKNGQRIPYCLWTVHRRDIVSQAKTLRDLVNVMEVLQKDIRIVFPVHPMTMECLKEYNMNKKLEKMKNVKLLPPMPYTGFIRLVSGARFVVTDASALQDEACMLGVPCLVLQNYTERKNSCLKYPIKLVGIHPPKIHKHTQGLLKKKSTNSAKLSSWDGKVSGRIVDIILQPLAGNTVS